MQTQFSKKENMKKQDKIKPKYNILQNTLYMVKLAWISKEKKVLIWVRFPQCWRWGST